MEDVLIVGAGPTGLVLALWLTRTGIKVRIIDKAAKAGTTSRAIVIHARNLEFYDQLGIAGLAVSKGVEITGANLWTGGKRTGHLPFTDLKKNISPYQYALGLPQDEQETMLEQQLAKLGVEVERNTELLSFDQQENSIQALLRKNGNDETVNTVYLAGCDGAHSIVRQQLGVGFPGGTYEETFYVADLNAKGLFVPGEVNIALDEADFLAIFPLKKTGEVRLVGAVRHAAKNKEALKWDDVSKTVINRLKIEVERINWFSTYRVHHRVASHFRKGNAFLLGDAGHIHSPVGGQGMNTGIGDAVNLAWKIGAVLKQQTPAEILDTYEPERIAFARRLVATTDNAFTFVSARGAFASWIRVHFVPYLLPRLFGFASTRRLLFRTISQIAINYRHSALSTGQAGKIKGGDRLPWVRENNTNTPGNFASLAAMTWQLHCYGQLPASVQLLCTKRNIPFYIFPWSEPAEAAGLKQNATYIVRPDGYVGLADPDGDVSKIMSYLHKWNIPSRHENQSTPKL
jgi:2-polyprenyl-6-methoxyphenol hydroxylase-like FAD-dependent oxidoreductase